MRLSVRKVVKFTTFLALIFILNIWISYNVNFWSFNNFDDRGKVVQNWRRSEEDNGGLQQLVDTLAQSQSRGDIQRGRDNSVMFPSHISAKIISAINESVHFQQNEKSRAHESHVQVDRRSLTNENNNNLLQKLAQEAPSPSSNNYNGNGNGLQQTGRTKDMQKVSLHKLQEAEETTLKDVFISVKTTSKYHGTRVKLLLKTWYLLAREQVYFFTDSNDTEITEVLGDHLINTNCSTDHSRRALSCKMAVEFDYYMASRKRWFCHVDDDVYLNVPRLVEMLQGFNHKEDWYLGKPSLKHPLEVSDRETPGMKLTFWFATGGAGFCISRSLALKMAPYAGGGRFMTTAENIRLPDDCTLGYIIEHLLKHKLTVVEEFHSHLEALWLIKPRQLEQQITLSFSEYSGKQNVINVQGFSEQDDPTRFKSLHCFLFPNFRECRVLS